MIACKRIAIDLFTGLAMGAVICAAMYLPLILNA